jgi:hypothetical protein
MLIDASERSAKDTRPRDCALEFFLGLRFPTMRQDGIRYIAHNENCTGAPDNVDVANRRWAQAI